MSALRAIARASLVLGLVAAEALMLYFGRNNTHLSITLLFVGWVGAPFAALAIADRMSRRWAPDTQRAVHVLGILVPVAVVTLFVWEGWIPARAPAAFRYTAVPPAAVALSAIILGAAALASRQKPQ